MDVSELQDIIARGEDSQHQFKQDATNVNALAAELVAFANSGGGLLLLGVTDSGEITGLTNADIARLNQLLSNAASQSVRPPINPVTQNIAVKDALVMVVQITNGLNRPYMDNQGRIWVKSGADKRHVTAREEIQRLFQQAGLVYADQVTVERTTIADLDTVAFGTYYERRYNEPLDSASTSLSQLLDNLNLARNDQLTLAGVLLFTQQPQRFRPAFMVKTASFPATTFHETCYLDSEDITGSLATQYKQSFAFISRNLHHVQGDQGVNTVGQLEIPASVFEELLVNALVHRDYFISAPIRVLVFKDRVEIISPGHLPNHLTPEQIRYGVSNMRNPALVFHATYLLPYRGLGSGIPRALRAYPNIELVDDRAGNQFKAIIQRPKPINRG